MGNRTDRGRPRDRNNSGDRSKSGCRSCKCESCEKILNLAKELKMNWCQTITVNEEIIVNFTENRKQVMILDLGAPVSVAGTEWMNQYLKDHNLGLENLKVQVESRNIIIRQDLRAVTGSGIF